MYSPQITPFQPSNIDATTKMLMGLQQKGQLQQYVAQHKNDPNLVALALYVSNMSKAKPAVQAEANQPKIVDQAIAGMAPQEMMPEDQGIATLPAPNMQNMAGGGIVAFDDGGEVPGYAKGTFTGTELTPYIEKYAQEYKINPSVLSRIVQAESRGKTTAKNPESTAHGAHIV
jgi:soluble lytic murein transglycosylase-like protein